MMLLDAVALFSHGDRCYSVLSLHLFTLLTPSLLIIVLLLSRRVDAIIRLSLFSYY